MKAREEEMAAAIIKPRGSIPRAEAREALHQELKSKAEIVKELGTAWYGMQEFYINDCNGYILGFAERK